MAEAAAVSHIWVVDDDRSVRFVLSTALRDAGYAVDGFDSAAAALQALAMRPTPDLLFTDVRMPGEDGLTLLDKLKAKHPQLPVIVMSAYTDVASTAGAFRGGAHEFLSKPFDLDDAVALAARGLPDADAGADEIFATRLAEGSASLIGDTPAMQALFRAIGRLAQAPLSVLINGETGTGKELVAHALHNESPRARRPFVALNTAAIPAELLESELFGHETGAFTGATKRHIGRFEQSRWRHAVSGRNRRHAVAAADTPVARAGRERILPRRWARIDPRRCACDRRDPPGSGSLGPTRPLPRRFATSPGCGAPAIAAAARTPWRHRATGRELPDHGRAQARHVAQAAVVGRVGRPASIRLARQRPRTGKTCAGVWPRWPPPTSSTWWMWKPHWHVVDVVTAAAAATASGTTCSPAGPHNA